MASLVRVDTKQVKLVLRMPRAFGFRMWLTMQALKLAGILSPVTIEVGCDHD